MGGQVPGIKSHLARSSPRPTKSRDDARRAHEVPYLKGELLPACHEENT